VKENDRITKLSPKEVAEEIFSAYKLMRNSIVLIDPYGLYTYGMAYDGDFRDGFLEGVKLMCLILSD